MDKDYAISLEKYSLRVRSLHRLIRRQATGIVCNLVQARNMSKARDMSLMLVCVLHIYGVG